ncbi:hypothetical protein EB1_05320 [Empedobacter brevis NBRC 14943 = ATCC 43319]|uniref:Uncharacterized protein n=1 Tax=Empedobacter brevis NBRC 14943 = ATCC 43319 TaxID=1218108 RepID=A0A511ND52_9FLAO|nr:hypothetical protein [Empedobacter brevis]GEM50742.1 hypothetical protein EB1_05320 [Empedobacter brevis NBRC 14943 = ATCC 43319]
MKGITNLEIQETREILESYFSEAELRDLQELRDNPLGVLQGLKLSILARMDFLKLNQLSRSISTLVRNFLKKTRNGFNRYSRCLACKTILRVLLYGFAAAIGIAITAINNQFNGIVDLLAKFFEQTTQSIETFLKTYGFQISAFNLFDLNDLIEKLCEEYGWC